MLTARTSDSLPRCLSRDQVNLSCCVSGVLDSTSLSYTTTFDGLEDPVGGRDSPKMVTSNDPLYSGGGPLGTNADTAFVPVDKAVFSMPAAVLNS